MGLADRYAEPVISARDERGNPAFQAALAWFCRNADKLRAKFADWEAYKAGGRTFGRASRHAGVGKSGFSLAAVLPSLPEVWESPPPGYRYDLGSGSADAWPTASVDGDPEGVYFVDHCGGSGPEFLGVAATRLVAGFGPITVTEV